MLRQFRQSFVQSVTLMLYMPRTYFCICVVSATKHGTVIACTVYFSYCASTFAERLGDIIPTVIVLSIMAEESCTVNRGR